MKNRNKKNTLKGAQSLTAQQVTNLYNEVASLLGWKVVDVQIVITLKQGSTCKDTFQKSPSEKENYRQQAPMPQPSSSCEETSVHKGQTTRKQCNCIRAQKHLELSRANWKWKAGFPLTRKEKQLLEFFQMR
ncbi:hypothetical protein [Capnocytophaga canimorsus]|uniref:hypothetical protein n=1 Tax=Capnocytophaga canimorsus TaxID=28188 RepID=UPI0037D8DDA2